MAALLSVSGGFGQMAGATYSTPRVAHIKDASPCQPNGVHQARSTI